MHTRQSIDQTHAGKEGEEVNTRVHTVCQHDGTHHNGNAGAEGETTTHLCNDSQHVFYSGGKQASGQASHTARTVALTPMARRPDLPPFHPRSETVEALDTVALKALLGNLRLETVALKTLNAPPAKRRLAASHRRRAGRTCRRACEGQKSF